MQELQRAGWFRHAGDSKFHAGAPESGSWKTLCNGRWPLTDVAYGLVEQHANPPADERCALCVLRAVAVLGVGAGDGLRDRHRVGELALETVQLVGPRLELRARVVALDAELPQLDENLREPQLVDRQSSAAVTASARRPTRSSTTCSRCSSSTARCGGALVEAIGIAKAAGRRGMLSLREQERLRELGKVVPQ